MAMLVVWMACFAVTAAAQPRQQNSAELRKKTFEKIWKTVDKNFYDPNFNGVDWKAVRVRYAPLVASAVTDEEFYQLMRRMLRELKVSHMDIIPPGSPVQRRSPPAFTGLGFRSIGGKVVITSVRENSTAAEAGLRTGFIILRIDGTPVSDQASAQSLLNGPSGTKVKITYLDAADLERDAEIERRPLNEEDKSRLGALTMYGILESKRIGDKVGYIYFSNFIPFILERVRSSVASMMETDGLIIDLRGNSGGDDLVGIKIAGMFLKESKQLLFSRTRRGDDQFEYFARATKTPYNGKLVILVDELSRSASEQFAAGLQEAGRATVVGNRTPGEDLDGDAVEMPDGSILIHAVGQPRTPSGRIIEGSGVTPNIQVSHTRADLLAGRDAQLQAAIDWIQIGK